LWYSLSLKSLLDICFVDEAPLPVSAGKRLHDGVSRRFEVFGGMLVRRRIAASDMPANQAHPQLDPAVSCFQALFAALRVRCYVSNLVEMSASFRHFLLLLDENPRAEFSRCAQSSQFGQFAPGPWHGRPARGKRDLTRVWIIAGTAMPRLACECLGGMRFPRHLSSPAFWAATLARLRPIDISFSAGATGEPFRSSCGAEPAAAHDPFRFPDGEKLVGLDVPERFLDAGRPEHLDQIGFRRAPQPEVQPKIVL